MRIAPVRPIFIANYFLNCSGTSFNAAESARLHEFFNLDEKVAKEVHVDLMGNDIDDLELGSQSDQEADETSTLTLLRASD